MAFSFPASPTTGQQSVQNGRTYSWTGSAWELVATGSGLTWSSVPASSTATGVAGQVRFAVPVHLRFNQLLGTDAADAVVARYYRTTPMAGCISGSDYFRRDQRRQQCGEWGLRKAMGRCVWK